MSSIEIIRQQEARLREAMLLADVLTLDELIHDQLTFLLPSGHLISKETDLHNYRRGYIFLSEIIHEDLEIQVHAETAIVTVMAKLKGLFQNEAFEGRFRYLRVWKYVEGKWQILAGSSVHLG
ncbi:MAG: nuclear transport factor 2 family protein [Bacteroidota bacterium]